MILEDLHYIHVIPFHNDYKYIISYFEYQPFIYNNDTFTYQIYPIIIINYIIHLILKPFMFLKKLMQHLLIFITL